MCVFIYMRIFTGNVWKGICLTVRSGYWLSPELVERGKGTRNFDFCLNFILFESFGEIMYCFYFKFQKLKWENKRRKWSNTDPQSMKKRGSSFQENQTPKNLQGQFLLPPPTSGILYIIRYTGFPLPLIAVRCDCSKLLSEVAELVSLFQPAARRSLCLRGEGNAAPRRRPGCCKQESYLCLLSCLALLRWAPLTRTEFLDDLSLTRMCCESAFQPYVIPWRYPLPSQLALGRPLLHFLLP